MRYEALILIGFVSTFILAFASSGKARYYKTAFTPLEAEDFKKPFRYAFWLSVMITSIISFLSFSTVAYLIASSFKAVN